MVTFNTVFNPTLDRCSPCLFSLSRESSDTLSCLFADADVIDIWRHLHPDQCSFTWTRSDGVYASRIDIIGCPSTWVPFITSSSILVCPYSDHDASALLFLAFPRVPRGPGYWKLNTSILDEHEYQTFIRSFWIDWKAQQMSYNTPHNWWDVGKF